MDVWDIERSYGDKDTLESAQDVMSDFVEANGRAFTENNLKLVIDLLGKDEEYKRKAALNVFGHFVTANKRSFTDANLKSVLEKIKSKGIGNYDDSRDALSAIDFFIQANPEAFTANNLKILIEVLKDDQFVGEYVQQAMTNFLEVNKNAFTADNFKVVLEMIKSGEERIQIGALMMIPLFLKANADLATARNLKTVLGILKEAEVAVKVIPAFLEADKRAFTKANFKFVFEMTQEEPEPNQRYAGGYSYAFMRAFDVIPYFLQANSAFATEANFKIFIDMLDGYDDGCILSALKLVSPFVKANHKLATGRTLKAVIEKLGAHLTRRQNFPGEIEWTAMKTLETAQEAISVFAEVNKEAFTEENLKLVLVLLSKEELHQQGALKALPFFVKSNKTAFTKANLEIIFEILKKKYGDTHTKTSALKALTFFLEADPSSANEDNFKFVLTLRYDFPVTVLEILPFFLKANPNLATQGNLQIVVGMDSSQHVRIYALEAIPAFFKANAALTLDPNFKNILIKTILEIWMSSEVQPRKETMEAILFFSQRYHEIKPIEELLRLLEEEISLYPPDHQRKIREQFITSLNKYMRIHFKEPQSVLEESGKILPFFKVVHDNLPLVLNAFVSLNKSAGEFEELRRILPFNNPLTRIIRMLGEDEDVVGGHKTVVAAIIRSGHFNKFLEIVIDIAKAKQRTSPQHISGMLEILSRQKDLSRWEEKDWDLFRNRINKYYEQGFKVITLNLFNFFIAYEDKPDIIKQMRQDIADALGNIGWGGFLGLSDEFKRKYNISTEDELGLLARYMPFTNLSAGDYANKYEQIKRALQQRGSRWTEEVDPSLRQLYRMKGTQGVIVYEPSSENQINREDLHNRLAGYVRQKPTKTIEVIIKEFLFNSSDPNARKAFNEAITGLIIKNGQLLAKNFDTVPSGDPQVQSWLIGWQMLVNDAYKNDQGDALRTIVRSVVDSLAEEELLRVIGLFKLPEFISIEEKEKLFVESDEMVSIISNGLTNEEKTEALKNIFLSKWFVSIKTENIADQNVFNAWVERGAAKFAERLFTKATAKKLSADLTPKKIEQIVREALLAARQQKAKEIEGLRDFERKKLMLADRVSSILLRIFDDDSKDIKKELEGYKLVERESTNNFYTGFFDDLLHLMGFALSGVCTWDTREQRVLDQRYHFGKIALKDNAGRLLGLSQVQFLRTGIRGYERKATPKGWQVIALPGINLDKVDIGVDKEKAVQVVLETAQRLAIANNMQGAVIPVESSINSNQPFVHTIIESLVAKGWLKKVHLQEIVQLAGKYTYGAVYLVEIPQSQFVLKESSLDDCLTQENRLAQESDEEISKSLSGKLPWGRLIYKKGISADTVQAFEKEIERLVLGFPKPTMEIVNKKVSRMDLDIRMRLEPDQGKSYVNRANGEIEITIGKDILYKVGKVETVTLSEMFSELIAAIILDDYQQLKEVADINENAYFKIEVVKALINYRNYLARNHKIVHKFDWNESNYLSEKSPDEIRAIFAKYKEDFNRFTNGMSKLSQWNIFLNVMDDADPEFLLVNYVSILFENGFLTEEDIHQLIFDVYRVEVLNMPTLAGLRNLFKDFILNGKANIKIGDNVASKEKFDHFDSNEMPELRNTLITTKEIGEFYKALRRLLEISLFVPSGPSANSQLDKEMGTLIDRKDEIFIDPDKREAAIRKVLNEILIRRIGGNAYASLKEHLTAQRGTKNIPYIQIFDKDLPSGGNADDYGFLQYVGRETEHGIDYDFIFSGVERPEGRSSESRDWVQHLFLMQKMGAIITTGPPVGVDKVNLLDNCICEIFLKANNKDLAEKLLEYLQTNFAENIHTINNHPYFLASAVIEFFQEKAPEWLENIYVVPDGKGNYHATLVEIGSAHV